MTQEEKRVVAPMINVNHNDEDTGLEVRVDLAGASKESVDLDIGQPMPTFNYIYQEIDR